MIKVLLLCLCMAACNDNDKEYSIISPEQESKVEISSNYTELLNKTIPVPTEYAQEPVLRGSIVQIGYDTKNYVEGNGEMRKYSLYIMFEEVK